MAAGRYVIWDFDGTLAHRPGGWASALMRALHETVGDHHLTPEALRPLLRAGFPWHQHEVIRMPGQAADAWWTGLTPVLTRVLDAFGANRPALRDLAPLVRSAYCDP